MDPFIWPPESPEAWPIQGYIGFNREGFANTDLTASLLDQWRQICLNYFAAFKPTMLFNGSFPMTRPLEAVTQNELGEILQKDPASLDSINIVAAKEFGSDHHPYSDRFLFSLDFGHRPWLRNPQLLFTFPPLGIGESEVAGVQQALVSAMSKCFALLSGLTGYLHQRSYVSLLQHERPILSHEAFWMTRLCGYSDEYRLQFFNGGRHSSRWIRSLSWGMFLTEEHLLRLGNLSDVQATLIEKRAAIMPFSSQESDPIVRKWFIQLTPQINAIPLEEYERFTSFLRPILPESIVNDCSQLQLYFAELYHEMNPQEEKVVLDSTDLTSDRELETLAALGNSAVCPIINGHTATSDLSELDNLTWIFDGILSEDQRGYFGLVYRSWVQKAYRGDDLDVQKGISVKYGGDLRFLAKNWHDESIHSALEFARIDPSAEMGEIMVAPIEFGRSGEKGLRNLVATLCGASDAVGAKVLLAVLGETSDTNVMQQL